MDEIVQDVEDKGSNSEYVKNATNKITSAVDENGEITFTDQPAYVNSKGMYMWFMKVNPLLD